MELGNVPCGVRHDIPNNSHRGPRRVYVSIPHHEFLHRAVLANIMAANMVHRAGYNIVDISQTALGFPVLQIHTTSGQCYFTDAGLHVWVRTDLCIYLKVVEMHT
jgi:hypothetical protein